MHEALRQAPPIHVHGALRVTPALAAGNRQSCLGLAAIAACFVSKLSHYRNNLGFGYNPTLDPLLPTPPVLCEF